MKPKFGSTRDGKLLTPSRLLVGQQVEYDGGFFLRKSKQGGWTMTRGSMECSFYRRTRYPPEATTHWKGNRLYYRKTRIEYVFYSEGGPCRFDKLKEAIAFAVEKLHAREAAHRLGALADDWAAAKVVDP